MGMLNSVEMRCPFLNPKLIQYFLSLKPSILYDQKLNKGKIPIRNLARNQIPKKIVEDLEKKGFVSDFDQELNSRKFYFNLKKTVNSKKSFTSKFLSKKTINLILEDHYLEKDDYTYLIWRIFALENWYKNFFKII